MRNLRLTLSFLRRIVNQGPILNTRTSLPNPDILRSISNITKSDREIPAWIDASDPNTLSDLTDSFIVYNDFISEEEETSLMNELEPYMRRLRYERDHWDDVSLFFAFQIIHCYYYPSPFPHFSNSRDRPHISLIVSAS